MTGGDCLPFISRVYLPKSFSERLFAKLNTSMRTPIPSAFPIGWGPPTALVCVYVHVCVYAYAYVLKSFHASMHLHLKATVFDI